ncbi:MAG: hypothetical protein M3071_07335 [Actinomycetota bacterium]|nr:hypothetical protein [Actinomycetota bacterium]
MPTSRDPDRRQRQLANLKRGGTVAPAGNKHAVKHGAYARIAEAELEEKTRLLFDALAADAPVRAADGRLPAYDAVVVRMFAEVLVRRERVRIEELRHGLETRDGRIRGVVEYGLRLDGQALDLARELGMTPAARAKLGLDLARTHRTLEDEIAGGREAWERRESIDGTAHDAGLEGADADVEAGG